MRDRPLAADGRRSCRAAAVTAARPRARGPSPGPGATPPSSPRNGMPWRSTASRLIRSAAVFGLRDLADVGGLLVGRHRPAADDVLRLADHQPGEVVAIHRAPGRGEQVVATAGATSGARERRAAAEPLALVDELPGPGTSSRGSSDASRSPRMNASRSARARGGSTDPGSPAPMGAPAKRVTGRIPATLLRQERLVGLGQVAGREPALVGRRPTRAPQRQDPRARRARQDRAGRAPAWRARRPRTRNTLADVALGQEPVDREEERVVRAGPAGLEAGVHVVGPATSS